MKGRKGFGGELGHVLMPYQSIPGIEGLKPECNCGRTGDLESRVFADRHREDVPAVLPAQVPGPRTRARWGPAQGGEAVRGMAENGDAMCKEIFRVQAHGLGLFFDEMINTFDPDALIVGGGALETKEAFQQWFLDEIREGMPAQREEQADIPIYVMPNGDTAGARGAAIEALKLARQRGGNGCWERGVHMNAPTGAEAHAFRHLILERRTRLEDAAPGISAGLPAWPAGGDRCGARADRPRHVRHVRNVPRPDRAGPAAGEPLVRFCLDHLSRSEARAHEQDLELATQIQSRLLPPEP